MLVASARSGGRVLSRLIARPLRLLGRVFGVRLEPQRISAEVEFTRPFETSSALAHAGLRGEGRIGESSEGALAYQRLETADGRRAVRPCQGDSVGGRVRRGGGNDVVQYLRHRL